MQLVPRAQTHWNQFSIFLGWYKRKSKVKAIALTDSTLLRFPSFLQPGKLKDEGEIAPQSKRKWSTAIPKSSAGIREGMKTNSHFPPWNNRSLRSPLGFSFFFLVLPLSSALWEHPPPPISTPQSLFPSLCFPLPHFPTHGFHLSSYPCCQEAGQLGTKGTEGKKDCKPSMRRS